MSDNTKTIASLIARATLKSPSVGSLARALRDIAENKRVQERTVSISVTLGTAGSWYVPVPWACALTRAYSSLNAVISAADEVLTLKNHAGTTMTGGTLTIAVAGTAAGDTDSASPTANNTFTAGQRLQVTTDGGSTATPTATLTFVFELA